MIAFASLVWFGLLRSLFHLSFTYYTIIIYIFYLDPKFSSFILPLLFLCPAEGEGERAAVRCFAAQQG